MLDPLGSDFFWDYLLWGTREGKADIWAAHDPVGMAAALEGKPLYVSWGDGQPGLLDAPDAIPDETEAWVTPQNEAFAARVAPELVQRPGICGGDDRIRTGE